VISCDLLVTNRLRALPRVAAPRSADRHPYAWY